MGIEYNFTARTGVAEGAAVRKAAARRRWPSSQPCAGTDCPLSFANGRA